MSEASAAGAILSHVEAIYRPEDRDLTIALFEALKCKVYNTNTKTLTGSDYLSVHPNPNRRDADDVIFLSEMNPEQMAVENRIRELKESDGNLKDAFAAFAEAVVEKPYGFSHIAIVYPDYETLGEALDGLEDRLTGDLKSRTVVKTFRGAFEWESIQTFVYTDLAVAGITAFGQVYELAAYGPLPSADSA